jgi:2-iminoacetate synthase ThiH
MERIPKIASSLDEMQNECLITLALKITDDTCKMDDYERSVFMVLYDALPSYQSNFFKPEVFDVITKGRNEPTAQIYATIKPLREAGMKYVTRPNMKAFKATIRNKLS